MSEKEKEAAPAPWVSVSGTAARLMAEKFSGKCTVEEDKLDPTVTLEAGEWSVAATWLREDLKFETCHLVTGIDRGPDTGTLEVVYSLYSRNRGEWLHVRIPLERGEQGVIPSLDSAAMVWRSADWHERETYDLVGVRFEGHPDLRRILLPDDWNGFPLRKDYTFPLEYHGIPDVYRMPGSILYEKPAEAAEAAEGGEG